MKHYSTLKPNRLNFNFKNCLAMYKLYCRMIKERKGLKLTKKQRRRNGLNREIPKLIDDRIKEKVATVPLYDGISEGRPDVVEDPHSDRGVRQHVGIISWRPPPDKVRVFIRYPWHFS